MVSWNLMQFFTPEQFEHPDKIDGRLVSTLDEFRRIIGCPIIVRKPSGDWRPRPENPRTNSMHYQGWAVDVYIPGLNVIDQWIEAERSQLFNGIGLYPRGFPTGQYPGSPGLHLDIRSGSSGRWIGRADGTQLEEKFRSISIYGILLDIASKEQGFQRR